MQLFVTLNAKGTVWGHVWVYHVPRFFRKWKTMFPFLGYGVEGRHRALKQEIRLSARGQWRGAIVGFVSVGRQSLVQLDLLSMDVALVGRTYTVTQSARARFDGFCAYMKQKMQDSGRDANC